jgi:hypothetical protein
MKHEVLYRDVLDMSQLHKQDAEILNDLMQYTRSDMVHDSLERRVIAPNVCSLKGRGRVTRGIRGTSLFRIEEEIAHHPGIRQGVLVPGPSNERR